jgi:hypothetical protein
MLSLKPLMKKAGLDRLAALYTAIETVHRGGTVSLSVPTAAWPIRYR